MTDFADSYVGRLRALVGQHLLLVHSTVSMAHMLAMARLVAITYVPTFGISWPHRISYAN